MPFEYAAYGVVLQANRALPGLAPNETLSPVDLFFNEVEGPVNPLTKAAVRDHHMISDGSVSSIQRIWSVPQNKGEDLQLFYRSPTPGAADFLIEPAHRKIECRWAAPATLQDVTTLLVGTVFNYVLRVRGIVCLHACVINIGSKAVAIIGDKGAGKSTTAAVFARSGYPILSDDIGAISEQGGTWQVQPGYPRLRLWHSSLEALQIPHSGLTRVLTPMDKYYLDLSSANAFPSKNESAWRFQPTPLPLAAVYLIERNSELQSPVIEPLIGIEKLTTLVTHTTSHFAPLNQQQRKEEFNSVSRIALQVDVKRARYPDGMERLPELVDAIVRDVEASNT